MEQSSTQFAASVWANILGQIQSRVPHQAFQTWIRPVIPRRVEDGALLLEVNSRFSRDWIEEHYLDLLTDAAREHESSIRSIRIVQAEEGATRLATAVDQSPEPSPTPTSGTNGTAEPGFATILSPRYVFDTFVVGRSNQFSHAAAKAVAEDPARTYNPLFIYGGAGLGKTHIMQAIGNHVLRSQPRQLVVYVSAENFMNEMISSIKENDRLSFRRKYRGVDLLLIDDIQFLEGKEATQEEFFHTFNALYGSHKQIVLTSDRPPKELRALEDRLISRFEWGLVTDIQPPDLETRMAILRKKAEDDRIDIDYDVTEFIAKNVKSNIRELEGCLIRLLAFASITGQEISLSLAQQVLRDTISRTIVPVTIDSIQSAVANSYNLSTQQLIGPKRTKTIALPRQIAMYLSRTMTASSLVEIGRSFGGRDHSTVLHAVDKIERLQGDDTTIKMSIERLQNQIEES